MAKYRKRPVIVDAVRWCKDGDHPSVQAWWPAGGGVRYRIKTLEGNMAVTPGDWIITGIKGEHYPCAHDIFLATYEKVEEE